MGVFKSLKELEHTIVENAVLFNNDCFNVFPQIENKSVDFVCIDPPYELDNHGGVVRGHDLERKLNRDKHINFISDGFDIEKIFTEIERISRVLNMICFCSNKQVSKIMNFWEQKKYSTTLLVWDKPNPIPLGNGKHISNLEFMVFVRAKGATFNNIGVNEQKKTFNYPSPSSKVRQHPTQKPIELLERLLKLHSNEEQIVLDCFSGSNTTGVACKNLNRKYIGIEMDKNYFDIGVERLKNSAIKN